MTCTPPLRAIRRRPPAVAAALVAATAAITTATPARAQNPTPPPPPPPPPTAPTPVVVLPAPAPASTSPPIIAAYRAPVLALVQPPPPALGGALTVPQDRPVVVFRFAQGEPADPIDAASFRVAVDGRDRTAQFQVTSGAAAAAAGGAIGEAWGALGDAGAPLAAGAHQVAARVCSSRGACGAVEATVAAVPPTTVQPTPMATGNKAGRRARVLGFVLQATKRLLAP